MAEIKTVIVLLNGRNYPTWKVQCRMALMKESLWGIISGTEETPGEDNADALKIYGKKTLCPRNYRAGCGPVIIISIERPGGSESSLEEVRGAAPA